MNTMKAYVDRRMPLLWELIMPLNARGITLDQVALTKFRKHRGAKVLNWQRRARRHFDKHKLGGLPIGPKGGFSNPKLRWLLYNKLRLPYFINSDGDITASKDALKSLMKQDKTGTCELLLENSLLAEARTALGVTPGPDGRVRTRFILGGDEKWDQDEAGRTSPASGRLCSRLGAGHLHSEEAGTVPAEVRLLPDRDEVDSVPQRRPRASESGGDRCTSLHYVPGG
jgi:hypothetical protein